MAGNTLGLNTELPICNADGSSFHNLVLRKFTVDSVVMSLGDKITGDVYYQSNTLPVTMQEYVEFNGVRYVLVDPPTIVREGMVSDNGNAKGMTKYSFAFYHPMYQLGNIPFCDVAVSSDQQKYLSEKKTFSWCGTGFDFIAKLNKNLEDTQWVVVSSGDTDSERKLAMLPVEVPTKKTSDEAASNILSFDNVFVSDALKTLYDTWLVPFVIDTLNDDEYYDGEGNDYYEQGKRYVIVIGVPSNEILDSQGNEFVFQFGQGVGLKNNSRTPRNNKIITRISGYGSTENVPFGYPQILWTGDQDWDYTINNDPSEPNSYPIYKGIVGGQYVKLIKHPFTRNTLMPSVYAETVNKKVNPLAQDYDPDTTIVDYYDADGTYINPIVPNAPSVEIHQFNDIKPRLGNKTIVEVRPYDDKFENAMSMSEFHDFIDSKKATSKNENEKEALQDCYDVIYNTATWIEIGAYSSSLGGSYSYKWEIKDRGEYETELSEESWVEINYTSSTAAFLVIVYTGNVAPNPETKWDDSMDDDGNYSQSYFKLKLPVLDFDLYACASITEEMKINMRSGACVGCTFPIRVDWEEYKANFYDNNGDFDPYGQKRDLNKFPRSDQEQITVVVQKDIDTFGTLLPSVYQQPSNGDKFVILGISMPYTYVTNAELELDSAMKEYMRENNAYYYDYPLKFDEFFLANNTDILSQIRNNTAISFRYGSGVVKMFVKQITIKYGENVLPQYDITLTDDIELVLNKIGQVTDDVSRMRVQVNELQKYYSEDIINEINNRISKVVDDVAQGRITFQQGLISVADTIFQSTISSPDFVSGLYDGRGWRIDELGNAEFESARVRSFLEIVELLVNRQQAQEGDTVYTDNDQIDRVDREENENDNTVTYVLSLKEKYDGYITSQRYGAILKGVINTLAAQQAGISNYSDSDAVESDGANTYYTSWMQCIGTHNTDNSLGINQIRVLLYGDNETPAGKNFVPCELMTIARRGGFLDPNEQGISENEKTARRRLQSSFYISTTEGRIAKLVAVNKPKLENWNYGTTLGELPDFVKNYANVRQRLIDGRDYLYAQGIVVGDFIKVDITGAPITNYVDCGEWVDGGAQGVTPSVGAGIYLKDEYNEQSLQYETHDVWHNGQKWRCLQHQPVVSGGVSTYYEPKWNSVYWKLVEGNANYVIEFTSSKGFSFRRGYVDTIIYPHLFFGDNTEITDDSSIPNANWSWERESESGKTQEDEYWDAQHTGLIMGASVKAFHLTNDDMPSTWSSSNKAIFTCKVTLPLSGNRTITVEQQLIS